VKESRKETVVKESKLLQTVKQGEVFKMLLDLEDLIKSLEAQHHPLKIFKSESTTDTREWRMVGRSND